MAIRQKDPCQSPADMVKSMNVSGEANHKDGLYSHDPHYRSPIDAVFDARDYVAPDPVVKKKVQAKVKKLVETGEVQVATEKFPVSLAPLAKLSSVKKVTSVRLHPEVTEAFAKNGGNMADVLLKHAQDEGWL